ncbi:MAG TPA: DHA2 family efflux MFS transporter permease subunit, partial [Dehalococcoidia bacterium]|nr:DHA2 family efflux MFS transporter permease subunit [Dehalococcoidia bacterium]
TLCGFAWNLPSLIVFRVLQGLGGGMLQPLGMAIVFTMITPLERPRFMGLLGLPLLLAPILGPTVGGYLVEYSTWRAIFLINLPIGVVNVVLAWVLLKETPIRGQAKMDFRGFALAAITFPCLLLGLSIGEESGWTSPDVLTIFVVGLGALAAFIAVELRQSDPMMQLRLFSHPMFRLAVGLQFVMQFSLFGLQFLLPIFLQAVRGLDAAHAGLVMFPMGVVSFVTMTASGRLYNRVGPKPLVSIGLVVLAATTALLSQITEHTSVMYITALASGRGLALGLCAMNVQTVAYNTVEQGQLPRATALTNVAFRVFGSIATALLTTTLVISLAFHGAPAGSSITEGTAPIPFMVQAFRDAFLAMTALSIVGFALSFRLHDPVLEQERTRGRAPARERELAAEL